MRPVSWLQLSRSCNQVRTPGCCLLTLAPQGPPAELELGAAVWALGEHFVRTYSTCFIVTRGWQGTLRTMAPLFSPTKKDLERALASPPGGPGPPGAELLWAQQGSSSQNC